MARRRFTVEQILAIPREAERSVDRQDGAHSRERYGSYQVLRSALGGL